MGEIYDLDALKRGIESVRANIAALTEGLAKEREKEREYERHIAAAEAILEMHEQGNDGKR